MANQQAVHFTSPGGRYVGGSHTERETHDYDGKSYAEQGKEGPFSVAIAIPKTAQGVNEFLGGLYTTAVNGYPNNQILAQRILQEYQSGFTAGKFRFKIKDGDQPSQKTGALNPNTVGCWVFYMQTFFQPPKITHYGIIPGVPNNSELGPEVIKRGDYMDVRVSVKVNDNTDGTAGIYINPDVLRLLGYGPAILGGVSTEQAFADGPAPIIPVGASLQPVGPQPTAQTPQTPQAPQAPQTPQAPQAVQVPQAQQYVQQPQAVQVPGMGVQQPQPHMVVPGVGQHTQQPQQQPQQQPSMTSYPQILQGQQPTTQMPVIPGMQQ